MSNPNDDVEAFLQLTRAGDNPTRAECDRVEAALLAKLAAVGAAGAALTVGKGAAAVTPASAMGATGVVGAAVGLKWAVVVGAVLVSGVGGAAAWHARREGALHSRAESAVVARREHVAPVRSEGSAVGGNVVAPREVVRVEQGRAPVQAAPGVAHDDLGAESALLVQAERALERGSAGQALALLEGSQGQFAHGFFAEEREATRIDALCALGRGEEAQRAGVAFRAAYPTSVLALRVGQGCRARRQGSR